MMIADAQTSTNGIRGMARLILDPGIPNLRRDGVNRLANCAPGCFEFEAFPGMITLPRSSYAETADPSVSTEKSPPGPL
jgi:hypothetical protein